MITRFICLANSFKEGGRCVAGVELDEQNTPVFEKRKPKWIRPVCNTPHGEIPTEMAAPFKLLDIIELEVTEKQPQGHQSENVAFDEKSIRICGSFNPEGLLAICDKVPLIFGNVEKAVSPDEIEDLNHSLLLLHLDSFEVVSKQFEGKRDRPQIRLNFSYLGNQYGFPITDPSFLHRYKVRPGLIKNKNQIFVCLSLGIFWKDGFYKLVAGIIY